MPDAAGRGQWHVLFGVPEVAMMLAQEVAVLAAERPGSTFTASYVRNGCAFWCHAQADRMIF
jgi:hypothetical protein